MFKIFLDDIRVPSDESWIVIKSYSEFIDFIIIHDFKLISEISLDHDLGLISETEKTGYDVAKWLIDYSIDNQLILPLIKVHSANPVGAKNIISLINRYLVSVDQNPTCISHIIELKRGIKINFE
jgi:hypothetical protein